MNESLHQRLLDGDDSALAELYDRFSSLVFGLALRVTRDRPLAEDVTQETFVKLWQDPSAFDPARGSLSSWLCMVAHRRSVDAIRRNESQKQRIDAVARQLIVDEVKDDPEEVVLDRGEAELLRSTMGTLPHEQRRALQLAYFEGLTYRQVAEVMEVPEGTAKSRIRLAMANLAESLRHIHQSQLEVSRS